MSCISAILDLRSNMARVLGARMNRVVTGRDENGNPAIVFQGPPSTVISAGKYVTTELWVSDPAAPLPAGADASTREWALEPPAGGACFRIVEIAPDDADQEPDDGGQGPDDADQEQSASAADHEEFQGAHQTDTLDYVTVLRGEVTLVVGDSQVTLRPGDSCVQQPGVPHDWQNRSAETSVMVGVLLSARR
jgi:mannose-6-phosphate isomerase-like protein (cupin superfamily)